MSYLNLPRLTFSGFFEADVNTINNDVRYYDSNVFEARFQTPQVVGTDGAPTEYNGWWNPDGSNAFRLLECVVTGAAVGAGKAHGGKVHGSKGPTGAPDATLTLRVEAQQGRTQAKIVDLDPQFQFASGLWGMRLSLMLGDRPVLSATLQPACFRDIYFGRVIVQSTGKPLPGSPSASARFTGTLTDLVWGKETETQGTAAALKAMAGDGGRLTLSLMTYGYSKSRGTNDFTVGSVIGSIGPWLKGDPEMFAPGRRFAPAATSPNLPFAAASGIGYLTGVVQPDGRTFSLDFGNSLPLWLVDKDLPAGQSPYLAVQDLGPLTVAVLKSKDAWNEAGGTITTAPCASEGDALTPDRYEVIGVVKGYDMAWLKATGGVVDLPIPPAAAALIGDHPLVVLTGTAPAPVTIGIRETIGGVWARADQFVQRIDTDEAGFVAAPVSIWAMRWGKPWRGAEIDISLQPPTPGAGGTDDPNEKYPPQTDIPIINIPADALNLPASVTSEANGVAVADIEVANPNNPRRYIDGQIYQINYSLAVNGQSPMPTFEFIAMHARDAFTPPPAPSWTDDVGPILVQYGNLYPIMSKGLFSFADPLSVSAHARLLHIAFTRPIEDPNYMPATRDLSTGKLNTILTWLRSFLPEGELGFGDAPPPPKGRPATQRTPPRKGAQEVETSPPPTRLGIGDATAAAARLGKGNDGKTAALRSYLTNLPDDDR